MNKALLHAYVHLCKNEEILTLVRYRGFVLIHVFALPNQDALKYYLLLDGWQINSLGTYLYSKGHLQ
jgi:hypothetical protein